MNNVIVIVIVIAFIIIIIISLLVLSLANMEIDILEESLISIFDEFLYFSLFLLFFIIFSLG